MAKPPATASTNAPVPAPSPEISFADAEEFFKKYKEAANLVGRAQTQEAAITLDLLARSLRTSPWMELAILKHSQLVEGTNDQVAEEGYSLLRLRIINAPYFQSNAERAQVFGVALQGAIDAGITRIRIRRLRTALERYHSKYREYPESLAKLAILGYTEMENTFDAKNQRIAYIPRMPQMTPFISYKGYESFKVTPPDPFVATSPKLESISQISEAPPKYSALIRLPGRPEPARLEENQMVQGYFIAAITAQGAIVSTPSHVLVLVAP